jgi:DNA-directed RNA polymerase specialized sigma subunit
VKTKKSPVDVKKLSKKYKVDINKVIKGWKADKTDTEIAEALHIDLLKLLQIRQEVEEAHLKERIARRKKSSP